MGFNSGFKGLIDVFNIELPVPNGTINLMRSFQIDKNFFDIVIRPKVNSRVYKTLILDPSLNQKNLIPIFFLRTIINISYQLCLVLPNIPFHSQFSTAVVCALLLARNT